MADKNTRVTTKDFPKIPNISALPIAAVPEHVIQEINNRSEGSEKYKIRLERINNTPKENKNGDHFSDTHVRKTEVPIPLVPKAQYDIPPKVDRVIVVKESDRDVYTGITLQNGDVYEFSDISGTIHPGILDPTLGRIGPDGLSRVSSDVKFPLHGGIDPINARPFCLLGKLNNYFFIGSKGRGKERFIYLHGLRLHLRINDDAPGNGNGEIRCRVRVWEVPRPNMLTMKYGPYLVVGPEVPTGFIVKQGDTIEAYSEGLVDFGGAVGGLVLPFWMQMVTHGRRHQTILLLNFERIL